MTTFQQCSELQDRKKAETLSDKFASVVVLDEVGLAEDSPKMPLKTLHPLLEDSDKTNDDIIETEESFSRVAFIGLSNWALDPAKMNRGILLSRGAPSEDELEETARYSTLCKVVVIRRRGPYVTNKTTYVQEVYMLAK